MNVLHTGSMVFISVYLSERFYCISRLRERGSNELWPEREQG
jgi:hypothetical protein